MPISSVYPSVPLVDTVDFWSLVQIKISKYMDRVCMIDGATEAKVTYKEFHSQVLRMRNNLWQRGMRKGDVFMNLTPNSNQAPVVMFACLSLGGIYTASNPVFTPGEIRTQLLDSNTRFFATTQLLLPVATEALKGIDLKLLIVYDSVGRAAVSFEDMLDPATPEAPKVTIHPREDIALMLFTSGTTGKPKGALISHYNLVSNNLQASSELSYFHGDDSVSSTVFFVPLFHIFGIFLFPHAITHGKTVVFMAKFHVEDYLSLLCKYQTPVAAVAPPIATLLAKSPIIDRYDLSFLRHLFVGAAPVLPSIEQAVKKRLPHLELRQTMGMTEMGLALVIPKGRNVQGSAGLMLPKTECKVKNSPDMHVLNICVCFKVVDPNSGGELTANQEGEVCFRGPQTMVGYMNNPEATEKAIDKDGWLATGDIGYYNRDGYIFITDRLKEVIKCKGFQVIPSMLESLLMEHDAVADAAVIGIPDDYSGEIPKAFVVLKENKTATSKEIQGFVAGKVAPYKHLKGGVQFIDMIPKSVTGKVLRRVLKEKNGSVSGANNYFQSEAN
ncbi:hypothetical protein CAPTEDRAFT_202507 [Capitella teleta]|uniref:4-coumarate--CoA ligase n=1 Tax=Capitella teleta TaxID=283909 RepID=R7UBT0_CAPTE|nr:hypothetical protein CAPTEDRAFT_202507 [Capitella teleta]|eukprot:ELU01263.1 hypothetical protein CAPTEDRAFT_202507 [Capitella teleta]